MTKPTIEELRDPDNGALPSSTIPGAYPIMYFTTHGEVVCPRCATRDVMHPEEWDTGIVDWEVYYEGADINCDSCGATIESAYGDPNEGATK